MPELVLNYKNQTLQIAFSFRINIVKTEAVPPIGAAFFMPVKRERGALFVQRLMYYIDHLS